MSLPFLIQGHRGARGLRPENTLPSFEAALDAGALSIETDVHLTADGVPVLIHDPVLPQLGVPVRRLTSAQVCGGGPADIPTLAALYRFIAAYAADADRKTDAQRANAARAIIDVEIKRVPFRAEYGDADRLERAVFDAIRNAGSVCRTWVRSFDHRCVRRLRQMEPRLTGVVVIEGTAPVDPVALVRAADAEVYAPDYLYLDEEQVRQCHDAGVRVLPWTVNEPEDWVRLIAWGVDGITTDYPDRLAAWLAQPPAKAR
jgi:glycerophosphoryl diester phosphodiesterase